MMRARALLALAFTLSWPACSGGAHDTGSDGGSAAGDGGPTDGGESDGGTPDGGSSDGGASDGGSSDGGGTGWETGVVSENCEAFIACVAAAVPEALGSTQLAYGPDSACWQSEVAAAACDDACRIGLQALAESHPTVEECGGMSETTVAVRWTRSGVELQLTGSGSFRFGMAETAPGSGDPWTAEDCWLGYTLGDGTVLEYCHPATTGTTIYAYGGDPFTLDEATQTVFYDNSFESAVTYYLEQGSNCWVWGRDTSYYKGLGCAVI